MSNGTGCDGDGCDVKLVARATLLTLVLTAYGDATMSLPLLMLAIVGLLLPRTAERPALFLVCGGLLALYIGRTWPEPDNHVYLLAWWCLAIGLALGHEASSRVLERSGRWMIATTFALALSWKALLSPDFVNGTFFRVMLSTDPRFVDLAVLSGALDETAWASAARVGRSLAAGASRVQLVQGPGLVTLAGAMTLWTLAIEGWVMIAHAAPADWRVAHTRVASLATFVATTYLVAPVEGFGWTLVALLLSQVEAGSTRGRAIGAALFLWLVAVRHLPWARLWAAAAFGDP